MGNGSRLVIDIETASLEDGFTVARPLIFMGGGLIQPWHAHPEYASTPWANRDRLTKREHAVAKLHTFLSKLDVMKNISEDEFETIKKLSIKRLKRARWAQYQQGKSK